MRDLLLAPDARYRDMLSGAFVEAARRPAPVRRPRTSASSSGRSCASRRGCSGCPIGRAARDLSRVSRSRPRSRRNAPMLDFLKEFMRPSHMACMIVLADAGYRVALRAAARAMGTPVGRDRGRLLYRAQQPSRRRPARADADGRLPAARFGERRPWRDGRRRSWRRQCQPARRRPPAVLGHDGSRAARARSRAAVRPAQRTARDRLRRESPSRTTRRRRNRKRCSAP